MEINFNLDTLIKVMKNKNYIVYDQDDYRLNIVGIRKDKKASNIFDDKLIVFYKEGTSYRSSIYKCTTDPGKYYLENGLEKGTAILKPGQYKNCFKLGLHKNEYEALIQINPVTVYRDKNKDNILDYTNPETGMFGINIHRANPNIESKQIDKWSAGCQVIADPKDFKHFIELLKKSLTYNYDDKKFTYTLLEEKDLI